MTETLWGKLESNTLGAVEVYELALDAGTLRYSSAAVTFSGNAYTALAIQRDDIDEKMEYGVARTRVAFSNVNHTLRSQFVPTDLVTGKDLTCRLIFEDGAGGYEADSLVLFKGRMERPERISETQFAVSVVGPLEGFAVDVPRRNLWTSCPWQYATAPLTEGCGYDSSTGTTTASNTGSDSTTLVVNSATFLGVNDSISIGGGAEVNMDAVSGTTITLGAARTWSSGDVVALTRCNREFGAPFGCVNREMEHRFGGFLGVTQVSRIRREFALSEVLGPSRPDDVLR